MEESLSLRVGCVFILGLVSLIGISSPLVASSSFVQSNVFLLLQSMAAGVMLGLALIHLLPESVDKLNTVWPDYPVCLTLTGTGLMTVLCIEQMTMSYINSVKSRDSKSANSEVELKAVTPEQGTQRISELRNDSESSRDLQGDIYCADSHKGEDVMYGHDHGHHHVYSDTVCEGHDHSHGHEHTEHTCAYDSLACTHDHGHTHVTDTDLEDGEKCNTVCSSPHCHEHDHATMAFTDMMEAKSFRDMVSAYALEMSTAIHSVIIGIGLGALKDAKTIGVLLAALCFHQFMEGIGLGAVLVKSRESMGSMKVILFVCVFTLVVPVGVIIGIFTSSESESSITQMKVEGILTSFAAGAMLYSALIELTAGIFNKPQLEDQFGLKCMMLAAYVCGYGSMALIGIWA